jgi:hypothetical protein
MRIVAALAVGGLAAMLRGAPHRFSPGETLRLRGTRSRPGTRCRNLTRRSISIFKAGAEQASLVRGGGLTGRAHEGGGFRGRGFHDHGDRFGFGSGLGYGAYGPYGYYDDYAYDYPYDSYYDNGDCYVVQRRVHTVHGWRERPVQVCG